VLREEPVQAIPAALRSKGGQANKRHGHGADYDYSHDFPEGISGQDYLERPVSLYSPKTAGWEAKIADRLTRWRQLKVAIQASRGEAAR
jgi:putative ATPase